MRVEILSFSLTRFLKGDRFRFLKMLSSVVFRAKLGTAAARRGGLVESRVDIIPRLKSRHYGNFEKPIRAYAIITIRTLMLTLVTTQIDA